MKNRKLILAVISFASLIFPGVVHAELTNVDFTVLGSNTVDITTAVNPDGYTIGNVTFRYDDLGSGVDSASVDTLGIFGTTGGGLLFDFNYPATSLKFNFGLWGVQGAVSDAMFISFLMGGTEITNNLIAANNFEPYDPLNPSLGGSALGILDYSGLSFDQVAMYFSTDGTYFDVSDITYELAPRPQLAVAITNDEGEFVVMITVTGPSGSVTEIQRATDLVAGDWAPVGTVTNFTGSYTYSEPVSSPKAFFRTR